MFYEVTSAKFFSVTADSTIDLTRIDQFSLSLRYVSKTGSGSEHFIQFEELPDGSAESFYDLLHNSLTKDLGLNVSDMRGQARTRAVNWATSQGQAKLHRQGILCPLLRTQP